MPHPNTPRHLTAIALAAALVTPLALAEPSPPTVTASVLPSFADVVARVTPAVVNVTVVQTQKTPRDLSRLLPRGLPDNSPLHEFFRQFHDQFGPFSESPGAQPREEGQGSGFIVDPSGYVVTNNHVIANADQITVTLMDGRRLPATLVGRDVKTDLALLKITAPAPLPAVALATAATARVGDWVIAVGNPFGLGGSVTAGIISARGRDIQSGPYDDYLQIDAPINRGNSGGPLFDIRGNVIGVNTAIYSPSGGNIGIGFAIPAETVAAIVTQLRDKGQVERGWLGIKIQPVTTEIAASLGLPPETTGVLVTGIMPDGPAATSGLRAGDVITHFAGQPLTDYRELTRKVAATAAGTTVALQLLRDQRREQLTVRIGVMPATEAVAQQDDAPPAPAADGQPAQLGLVLAPLTPALRSAHDISAEVTGVLVTQVQPGSAAAQAGIEPGSVISMVGQQAVTTPADVSAQLQQVAAQKRPSVLLRIEHAGEQRFVAVPFTNDKS